MKYAGRPSSTSEQGPCDSGTETIRKVKDTSVQVSKAIIYGNNATRIANKRDDGHTHKWTVYVKPFNNENMSSYVEKVNFRLHDSFKKPSRDVTEPPYEVTETGWGEFEIRIQIFFKDPCASSVPQVTMYHILQLFKSSINTDSPVITPGTSVMPVLSGFYEEVIFWSPSLPMRDLLVNPPPLVCGPYKHDIDYGSKEAETLGNILDARKKIKQVMEITLARYETVLEEINAYRKVEMKRQAAEMSIIKKGKKKKKYAGKKRKRVTSVKSERASKTDSDDVQIDN